MITSKHDMMHTYSNFSLKWSNIWKPCTLSLFKEIVSVMCSRQFLAVLEGRYSKTASIR